MSRMRRFPWVPVALLALLVVLIAGLSWLVSRRLSGGDVYPEYSSLRADPKGTRAWYESLEMLPGIRVSRDLRDLKKLSATPARTLIFAGVNRSRWERWPEAEVKAINAAAQAGSRVVVIFSPEDGEAAERAKKIRRENEEHREKMEEQRKRDEKRATTAKSKPAQPSSGKPPEATPPATDDKNTPVEKPKDAPTKLEDLVVMLEWAKAWGYVADTRIFSKHTGDIDILRTTSAPAALPVALPWVSDVYFEAHSIPDWRVIYLRAGFPVVIERAWGKGSLVLVADAASISNEALQKSAQPAWLAWLTGPSREIVFCEQIHGLALEPGVAALARRYGLAGAFFVLLFTAALFIWQRAALFVPPERELDEQRLTYEQTAGLEALLRRTVPPGKLLAACRDEHARHARAGEVRRLAEFFKDPKSAAQPVETYNEIVRSMKRRVTSLF